jgi:hypothetical protein
MTGNSGLVSDQVRNEDLNRDAAILTRPSSAQSRPKSAEMTPGPGFRVRSDIERPSPALIEVYREYESADISDMLNRMYTMCADIHNLTNDQPLVGPACTVKVFPGDNLMLHKALDVAKPGDVVVVDYQRKPGKRRTRRP